jgi:hypothetical protein
MLFGHPDFDAWMKSRPKNDATYTSPDIQNDIIDIIVKKAIVGLSTIVSEINETRVYSIMLDETMDVSKVVQVSFCVRYVDLLKGGVVQE